ncbi:hypothetical protein AMECASPLE_006797 [Ameca splendens]|uniref:Secreted protein n=1 Tax=Ameca splendens TaxID=208324 RepID=A0ABV0XCK8_9TELE
MTVTFFLPQPSIPLCLCLSLVLRLLLAYFQQQRAPACEPTLSEDFKAERVSDERARDSKKQQTKLTGTKMLNTHTVSLCKSFSVSFNQLFVPDNLYFSHCKYK